LRWLRGPGKQASAPGLKWRFTLIRLSFNNVLSRLDLFSDVMTRRSESETGSFLSGLDVFAADSLELPGGYFKSAAGRLLPPPRAGGGSPACAERLLGGENAVAIVRVRRE
jgi:hypothetical protein